MPRICRPLARLCVALPFLFAPLSVEALEAPDERDATDLRFEPPMSDGAPAWPNLAEPGTVVDGASSFSGLNLAQSDLPTQGSTKGGSASSAESVNGKSWKTKSGPGGAAVSVGDRFD